MKRKPRRPARARSSARVILLIGTRKGAWLYHGDPRAGTDPQASAHLRERGGGGGGWRWRSRGGVKCRSWERWVGGDRALDGRVALVTGGSGGIGRGAAG